MSVEDTSFPNDDFEISPSTNSYEANQSIKHNTSMESLDNAASGESSVNTEGHNRQTPGSNTNQNESNQSSLGSICTSESSGKTNTSETAKDKGDTSDYSLKAPKKATSYQDIHSEYTKKRYKHIESKVGKYIANMRALDQKRRGTDKLLTHRSLPETLSVDYSNGSQQFNNLAQSIDSFDCAHYPPDGNKPVDNEQETANSSNFIYLNTTYYMQLLKDKERKDYLQAKLEEKNTENFRLKQNLDIIRIQLSQCQDKLKQKPNPLHMISNYDGNMNAVDALVKYSLPSLLYTSGNPTKSTQTEITLTPSPILTLPLHIPTKIMDSTPMTPEFQNTNKQEAIEPQAPVALKLAKCVAAIQPISLNFSNLLEQTDRDYNDNTIITMENKSTPAAMHNNNPNNPNNNNNNSNVIHSNITGLTNHNDTTNDIESVNESIDTQIPNQTEQRSRRQSNYYSSYCDKHSQYCNAICEKCYTSYRISGSNSEQSNVNVGEGKCKRCKHRTVRHRLLHLISSCITCKKICSKDLGDISGNTQKSPYSHIPLLETRFPNRYHANT